MNARLGSVPQFVCAIGCGIGCEATTASTTGLTVLKLLKVVLGSETNLESLIRGLATV